MTMSLCKDCAALAFNSGVTRSVGNAETLTGAHKFKKYIALNLIIFKSMCLIHVNVDIRI